jgi:5'-AMP-activated protein kinase catalytic alpha subunit
MMLEIFRALRALRFEWKIVAQYHLKCRPCTQPQDGAGGAGGAGGAAGCGMLGATRCKVKVGLQLFKIQEGSYLLDIRKVDGDVLPFMDVCALLLGELKLI